MSIDQLHHATLVLATVTPDGEEVTGLAGFALDIMERLGYAGIAGLIALESIVPPIPSEAILPLGGWLAETGTFSLPLVLLAATVGSLVGALVLYAVAAIFGRDRLIRLVQRFGTKLGIHVGDIEKAERWFQRRGKLAVLIGRCVPIVRSLVSLPAGFARMNMVTFILYTTIGSLVWNSALVAAGWFLGSNWERVEGVVSILQYIVVLLALFLAGRYVMTLLRRRKTA